MSLINDALKKAQKQRTGDTPPLASMPSIGGETATRIAKRAKPAGFNTLLVRFGLIGGGVLVLLIGGYFVLRKPSRAPATATAPVAGVADPGPASPRPVATAPQASAPGSQPPIPNSTPVTFNLPTALPAATPTTQPATPSPVAGVADPGPASPRPATPAPTAVKPAPAVTAKIDGKSINYIEALRIAGIRASATDSKVLMNDRVYRVGDIVEHEMGLKLVGITSSSLTFENEAGARYTRNF